MRKTVFLTAAMAVLACAAARAQYPGYELPRWRVTGYAGFNLGHTSQSVTGQNGSTDQLFPLGDLRLTADGFALDPRFLHLNTALEFQKGVNTSDAGDLDAGGLNLAVGAALLPNSHYPLRVSYIRTNHGVSGLGFDQKEDASRLDVQWTVFHPKLPHITTSLQMYGDTVHVPTSFSDQTYDQNAFNVGVSDNTKGWNWAGNFSMGNGNAQGASLLDSKFTNKTRTGGVNVNRIFWDNKAWLYFENREVWRKDSLASDGTNQSSEFTNNATFDVQVHPKVIVGASYAFSDVNFEGSPFGGVRPAAGQIVVVPLASSTFNGIGGHVDYRPFTWLRLNEELRTTFSSPIPGVFESRTSYTDSATTVAADHHWRAFDVAGSYTGRFQLAGTTLDNSPNSWSNSFYGRLGWGDVRHLRLTASGEDIHLNLVEQIGGFTNQLGASLEAESHWVKHFRLRGSGVYSKVELLNLSGDTRSKMVTYSAAAEHRLFSVSYGNSFVDGVGAVFPLGLIDPKFLVVPLPISQLISTPLLARTIHAQTVSFLAKPRRNLQLSLAWRGEDTQLVASDEQIDFLQAYASYRLGKFTLEGGYWRNINDVTFVTGLVSSRLALWYFRIGRDFRIL